MKLFLSVMGRPFVSDDWGYCGLSSQSCIVLTPQTRPSLCRIQQKQQWLTISLSTLIFFSVTVAISVKNCLYSRSFNSWSQGKQIVFFFSVWLFFLFITLAEERLMTSWSFSLVTISVMLNMCPTSFPTGLVLILGCHNRSTLSSPEKDTNGCLFSQGCRWWYFKESVSPHVPRP